MSVPHSISRVKSGLIGVFCGLAVAACLRGMLVPALALSRFGIDLSPEEVVLLVFASIAIGAVCVIAGGMRALAVCIETLVALSLVAAIVLPGLRHHGGGGNEASAIGSLRAINSGESTYESSCAAGGYATELADLAAPRKDERQGFVSPDLSANGVLRSGYFVRVERNRSPDVTDVGSPAATCNGSKNQPASSYFASANPEAPGYTGTRYFATDARGTIFQSTKGPIQNPVPPDATPNQ
jgi:hypothetical protein